jgi:hypothetical protein
MLNPNVNNYLLILGSKLIDQDRRDSAREAKRGSVNVYRKTDAQLDEEIREILESGG